MRTKLIKVENLSKNYGTVKAVKSISFELKDGQVVGFLGANGAGKSTVLDALTFSLFNKPFRKISKGQLINTVNEKDCRVEVEFSIAETWLFFG